MRSSACLALVKRQRTFQTQMLTGVAHSHQQPLGRQRLDEKIISALPHGLDRHRYRTLAGDGNHLRRRGFGAQPGQHIHSGAFGQIEAEQHDLEKVIFHRHLSGGRVGHNVERIVLAAQEVKRGAHFFGARIDHKYSGSIHFLRLKQSREAVNKKARTDCSVRAFFLFACPAYSRRPKKRSR